jgi:hypothetical protein
VPDALLADHLHEERTRAARAILRAPLLDIDTDPEAFRLVVRHHGWLVERFETTCGWHLTVDAGAGFARLAKRAADIDVTRPLKRDRGSEAPFDRRRYELLCLVAAELVRHPVSTVGLLARAVTADAGLDTSRRSERVALVDALRALMAWGAARATAGDVDAFADDERGNAILHAETARIHHLLVSATAPSSLPDDLDTTSATDALLAEPRYGDAASRPDVDEERRLRWVRHALGRRTVDYPAIHDDDLTDAERDYLANPAAASGCAIASPSSDSSWRNGGTGSSPSIATRSQPTRCSPARTATPTSSPSCWSTAWSAPMGTAGGSSENSARTSSAGRYSTCSPGSRAGRRGTVRAMGPTASPARRSTCSSASGWPVGSPTAPSPVARPSRATGSANRGSPTTSRRTIDDPHFVPRPRRPFLAAPSLALARMIARVTQ